jgi:hypothetical protein
MKNYPNPINYSKESSIRKAIINEARGIYQSSKITSRGFFIVNCKFALIEKFGKTEKEAAELIYLWQSLARFPNYH